MTDRSPSKDAFFVGYLPVPKPLILFLAVITGVVIGAGVAVAAVFTLNQQDWGDARFQWNTRNQMHTGVLQAAPYPVVYVPPSEEYPRGRAIVMSGQGKRGVQQRAEQLDGQAADVGGVSLGRSELGIEFIQVGGKVRLRPAEDASTVPDGWLPPVEDLGEKTLRGELVDSKCYLGAMRPGQGKTHKVCANLCIIGGIPPMFVVYREQGEPLVMLLGDSRGEPLSEDILVHTSHYVELTGQLERRADLLVFKVDPASLKRL